MSNKTIDRPISNEDITIADEVFISYSRLDIDVVRKIIPTLQESGYKVWLDTDRILPTSIWSSSIISAIDNATAFIFVVTITSLESAECNKELQYALEHGKKIIPLIIDSLNGLKLPEVLNSIQGIIWNSRLEDEANVEKIIKAIKIDVEWYNWHANMLEQSHYWLKKNKNKHLLLRGSELITAELWLAKNINNKFGTITELQNKYIIASRNGTAKRLLVVAVPAFVLSSLLITFLQQINSKLMLPSTPKGIINLEMSTTISKTRFILDTWKKDNTYTYAIMSVSIDYLFILSYVLAFGLSTFYYIIYFKRRSPILRSIGMVIFSLIIVAGFADIVENSMLLSVLLQGSIPSYLSFLFWISSSKFLLIALSVLYILSSMTIILYLKGMEETQNFLSESSTGPDSLGHLQTTGN